MKYTYRGHSLEEVKARLPRWEDSSDLKSIKVFISYPNWYGAKARYGYLTLNDNERRSLLEYVVPGQSILAVVTKLFPQLQPNGLDDWQQILPFFLFTDDRRTHALDAALELSDFNQLRLIDALLEIDKYRDGSTGQGEHDVVLNAILNY